jgi:hypothetical protein
MDSYYDAPYGIIAQFKKKFIFIFVVIKSVNRAFVHRSHLNNRRKMNYRIEIIIKNPFIDIKSVVEVSGKTGKIKRILF